MSGVLLGGQRHREQNSDFLHHSFLNKTFCWAIWVHRCKEKRHTQTRQWCNKDMEKCKLSSRSFLTLLCYCFVFLEVGTIACSCHWRCIWLFCLLLAGRFTVKRLQKQSIHSVLRTPPQLLRILMRSCVNQKAHGTLQVFNAGSYALEKVNVLLHTILHSHSMDISHLFSRWIIHSMITEVGGCGESMFCWPSSLQFLSGKENRRGGGEESKGLPCAFLA